MYKPQSRTTLTQKDTQEQQRTTNPNRRQFAPKEKQPPAAPSKEMIEQQDEDVRATLWELTHPTARSVALRVAGLDPKRASESLTAFSAVERERIATHLTTFVSRLEVLIKCTRKTPIH